MKQQDRESIKKRHGKKKARHGRKTVIHPQEHQTTVIHPQEHQTTGRRHIQKVEKAKIKQIRQRQVKYDGDARRPELESESLRERSRKFKQKIQRQREKLEAEKRVAEQSMKPEKAA